MLLVCPGANRSWHRFCLRQADRVVLVAAADTAPDAALRAQLRDGYVVLVGEPPSPELLREWYAAVDPRFVFRATDETLPDVMASVAARLAGRSIGVAIAGGGARSIAGIGVLEELIARGFTIDRLAGCSVGAVVAAFYATGRDATAVDAVVFEEFVRRNPFNDYRIPKVSLVRGRKTEAAIARYFTDVRFEDLPRELVLVSTDLLRRELVVHRRGSVGEALRASLSLPGLYPPARIADTLHVDGGILDNLPTDPLVDRGEGPVIGVNIAAASSVSAKAGPPRMPGLGETLMRTILMAGASALDRSRERATVVVTPDTRGIGLLEFHQIDRAREAGRAAGAAAADALDSLLAADAPPPAVVTLPAPRRASGTARSASRLDLADDG
ncbi:MAG: patatin-like phospholipase family protein [Frankiales bacterium]|nr:patatin-like phospholipase family protein [Frankiales bacterium]